MLLTGSPSLMGIAASVAVVDMIQEDNSDKEQIPQVSEEDTPSAEITDDQTDSDDADPEQTHRIKR
ncbi:hypothetical protein TRL7639_01070 [Falsiruegeria litorea R37]|uniref:Uncharacterized protein n=2 Tax=Falsiruegeria litorea TaxID=1280831 RepID=A0A1Y5S1Q2_9RHOB|nr:hypothetical protein TRL7639_01070 [Falsiruegeria litorea R37]